MTKQLPDATLGGTGTLTYEGKKYFTVCNSTATSTFTFQNKSTTTSTNTNYRIIWGDGTADYNSASFSILINHDYGVGVHNILFIVSGTDGCIDTSYYYAFLGTTPQIGLGSPGNTSVCSNSTLTFPINTFENNSPGTTYSMTFSDGTPTFPVYPVVPASVSHTFDISSCGAKTEKYTNAFAATIVASNPCFTSSATVEPIYVSQKPVASFTIDPKDTVCINNIVQVTNTSAENSYIANGGTCQKGGVLWQIIPLTGYSITSGTLGSDNGSTDPTFWMNGSQTVGINFTTPGTYTVTLKLANPNCGSDAVTKTICVSSTPTADFTTDVATTGCAPFTLKTTNNSNHPECGKNQYVWTVSSNLSIGCDVANPAYDIQLAATTSFAGNLTWQWSGPNGYSSPEQNPVIPNAAANRTPDTYSVTATATTGNCPSKPSSVQVIVHPAPGILSTIKTDPSACATPTGSITLHTSLPNTSFIVYYTYKGNAATVTLPADGNGDVTINALPAGIYDHIYVEAAGCSSPETGAITLSDPSPPAAPTVSSNSPLCAGGTLNLQAVPAPGVTGTYAWNGPNNFSSTNQNPMIANVQANNNGTYNVTITVNNCTSPAGTTNVIVNPLAAAPAAPSPVEYCVNTTAVPLTATATNGSSLSWYEVVSGGTELPSAPTPSTATAGSVFYYVSQTSMAGREGARTPVEVVTRPDAKAVLSPTQTLGCSPFVIANSIVNLQAYPNNNGNYRWYVNDGLTGSGATFPGYTIGNDGDSVTIKLKALSLFGCKDDSTAQKFFTYQLPKTAFTSSSTGGCGPLNISFINKTPQASLFKFKWIFGNGQT